MSQVIVFLANGFEEIEALTVTDLCRRASIGVVMMSITTDLQVKGSHGIRVEADSVFDEGLINAADVLVLPGGMPGTNHLLAYQPLRQILKVHGNQKIIAAICAAPIILADLDMLGINDTATANPGFTQVLKQKNVVVSEAPVVVSNNIITSRGLGTAIDFSLEIIEKLTDRETRLRVEEGIVYQGGVSQ